MHYIDQKQFIIIATFIISCALPLYAADNATFTIVVRTFIPYWDNFKITCSPTTTILGIKQMIASQEGITSEQQNLTIINSQSSWYKPEFTSQSLANNKTCTDCGIKNNTWLYLNTCVSTQVSQPNN